MKRNLAFLLIVSLILPVMLIACDTEMNEDDYVYNLRDRRYRDAAMMYVQEHRTKAAVPVLLELIKKRYSTLKAVYTLGIIGDPVAVPPLLEELKGVAKKDSLDHDRLTEQICMTLGMIGAANSVDTLLWTVDNAGEMGKAGAVQALGMIGDKRATKKLIEVLKDSKEKIQIRHYAAIALGRIGDPEAADALVYALYVDDNTGLNLFRDGQLSLIQIGGEAARNALIKGYEGKNEDVQKLAEEIQLKPEWVQIKIVNVMGELRDPQLEEFLMARFEDGLKNDIVYEVFAKVVQALERTPLSEKALDRIVEVFKIKPPSTAYLNERELLSKVLIWHNGTKYLDDIMSIAEQGDIRLKNPREQWEEYSQWCVAAANIVSTLGDAAYAQRFDEFVKAGKCKAQIWGLKMQTPEILANMNVRMQAAAKCKDQATCWAGTLKSPQWPAREKAVWYLSNTGDKTFVKDIIGVMYTNKEEVRYAVMYAIWKLATPETMPQLIRFWQDEKIAKDFQKITEDIGYILYIKMRDFKMDQGDKRKALMDQAQAINKEDIPTPPPLEVSQAEAEQDKEKAKKDQAENAGAKDFD